MKRFSDGDLNVIADQSICRTANATYAKMLAQELLLARKVVEAARNFSVVITGDGAFRGLKAEMSPNIETALKAYDEATGK